ncbi:hypothetical protein [Roseiconus lacunae]|uniref:Uncharacterized protein n=1 Tax=Roseiconus lacunae TaxID=2605694 RepID=A0ABT7PDY8_9BACT|nr:hypothetical protein [Roseiconus lacunae]MCD0463723.1 hypothetical protein [Roseiconus lacunae]MDM4014712.1 hypothetical protein [Roseiconus lacunae]WRQ50302.1 hypothetical protein U8335_25540 [Stieleria sp. HD01]
MIQLEAAQFSNLTNAVQRTGSLTGGAVRGLPNDVVIDGLPGVQSYPSSIAEAQKEFELGRARTALERVRQLETSFNTVLSQWNGTVNMVISGAKQGHQAISAGKLNEVRNAQTRMQTLVGPAVKAFRDLITALEFEITLEGHQQGDDGESRDAGCDGPSIPSLPAPFDEGYEIQTQLRLEHDDNKKTRVVPQFQTRQFYLFATDDGGRVVRVDELRKSSLHVYDFSLAEHVDLSAKQIVTQIKRGTWELSRLR